MKQVKSIDVLKDIIAQGEHDFFIALNGGARSSKTIDYNEVTKKFHIVNESDGTKQVLTEKSLFNRRYTNIGYAMSVGALYYYY